MAPLTTLGVGGAARYFATANDANQVSALLQHAGDADWPVMVLGGGSNLLIADSGFPGLVIQLCDDHIRFENTGDTALVHAGAGVNWDDLVAAVVGENWAGLECLSGIPGRVGAAPIQNVGAYGQEVSGCIQVVRAVDRRSGETVQFTNEDCGFDYRQSHFKGAWIGQYVVTGVTFSLQVNGEPTLRYQQLIDHVTSDVTPTLQSVRDAVLAIRRQKSMVLDSDDPNTRSAGSFFMNPIVSEDRAAEVRSNLEARGIDVSSMPLFPIDGGEVKLSAAWLMDRLGFERGYGIGAAGLSSNHALAVINRGDASADDIIALAGEIVRRVRTEVGVTLTPEPAFVGFDASVSELLGL